MTWIDVLALIGFLGLVYYLWIAMTRQEELERRETAANARMRAQEGRDFMDWEADIDGSTDHGTED